jgi:hypothetical protein
MSGARSRVPARRRLRANLLFPRRPQRMILARFWPVARFGIALARSIVLMFLWKKLPPLY